MKAPMSGSKKYSPFQNIAKGAAITIFGRILTGGLGMLYILLISRVLPVNSLGQYYLGLTVIGICGIISVLGLDTAAVRFVSIYADKNVQKVKGTFIFCSSISVMVGIFMMIIIILFKGFISNQLFGGKNIESILGPLSVCIPFFALHAVCAGAIRAFRCMQYDVYVNFCSIVSKFIFTFLFFFIFSENLMSVIYAHILSSILATGLYIYFVTIFMPIFRTNIKCVYEFNSIVSFGWPLVFSRVILTMISHMDTLMLGFWSTNEMIAIYNISKRIVAYSNTVRLAFLGIFNPYVARYYDNGELVYLCNLYRKSIKTIFLLTIPIFAILILFPEAILKIFGSAFIIGASCLVFLSLGYLIDSTFGLTSSLIVMSGRTALALMNNCAAMIVNIVANCLLIPRFGATGAALATGLSLFTLNVLRIFETYFLMKIHPFRGDILRAIITAVISIVVLSYFESGSLKFNFIYILCIAAVIGISCLIISDAPIYAKKMLRSK